MDSTHLACVSINVQHAHRAGCNVPPLSADPLDFTPAAAGSRLWGGMSTTVRKAFAQNVTTNWHHWGVAPATIAAKAPALQVLSTNVALNGQTFVSSLEGRDGLPVFGVQVGCRRRGRFGVATELSVDIDLGRGVS